MPQNNWTHRPPKSGYYWFKDSPTFSNSRIVLVYVFGPEPNDFNWHVYGDEHEYWAWKDLKEDNVFLGPIPKPEN